MSKAAFDKAMDEYYAFRNWDEAGRPTTQKLEELGIEQKFIREYRNSLQP